MLLVLFVWMFASSQVLQVSQVMQVRVSLVGPEDLVRDLAEEHFLLGSQVSRSFLSDEGFSVEERHLCSASTGLRGGEGERRREGGG